MDPVSIALIGCGIITRSAHQPALTALGGRVRLVATVDTDPEAARHAAEPFGARVTDIEGALADPAVEAVLIATPESCHAEQVIAAAKAGKHVMCEKPIAPTLEEADDMIAACDAAGIVFMVAHSRRFTRRYMDVAADLSSGRIGQVRLVRENERRPQGFGPGGVQTFRPGHWTGDPKQTLGIALLAGIHEADIINWFASARPVTVVARHAVTTPGNQGVPDFLSFAVRFDNGAIGTSEIGRMQPPGYPAVHQLEIYGTQGAIRARDHDCQSLVRHDAAGAHHPESLSLNLSGGQTYVRQLAAFVDAIRSGQTLAVTPQDARLALAVTLAAIESAETGRRIAVKAAS
ncbi:1,5-anhydro-D-fructose reductase (plasmid) [Antarctobacter heliothermus]|uniref:1,5-anhydro-D-fructose reductase n=1 Tax=Antarctobacter heliothermus TaxID=74033 RepID=A0A222EBJ3_9RHOB|nr:Gfo/Idh/MocA family oxidoreductase [Antarctobacter heliothermus]ASP23556.1 1,5-anhydro-D-fructose reductase [Antarctobacter heliothermus]